MNKTEFIQNTAARLLAHNFGFDDAIQNAETLAKRLSDRGHFFDHPGAIEEVKPEQTKTNKKEKSNEAV